MFGWEFLVLMFALQLFYVLYEFVIFWFREDSGEFYG